MQSNAAALADFLDDSSDASLFLEGVVFGDEPSEGGGGRRRGEHWQHGSLPPRIGLFPKMYWVPIIFSIVYFLMIAMLWTSASWFRRTQITLSPIFLTILWALMFAGIIWTWIKCLQFTDTRRGVGWVTFFFILNLLLLLLVAYAFLVAKNIATAGIAMIFLWLSALALIFVAARHWTPGLLLMLIYLLILTWAWVVFGRIAFAMVNARNKMVAAGIAQALGFKQGGLAGVFTNLKNMFNMNGAAAAAAAASATLGAASPVLEPGAAAQPQQQPVAGTPLLASPTLASEELGRGAPGAGVPRPIRHFAAAASHVAQPQAATGATGRGGPARAPFIRQELETAPPQSGTPKGTWRSRGLSNDGNEEM